MTIPEETNPWRDAVDAALVSAGLDCLAPDTDPAAAVTSLVENEVAMALDPAISERAQALVERGNSGGSAPSSGGSADDSGGSRDGALQASAPQVVEPRRLWLWRNHVDGRPEYWAFDNAFPLRLDGDDPQTLGEPCGYALLKPSRDGRPGFPDEEVLRRIAAASPTAQPPAPDVVTDARRYRLLRRGQHFGVVDGAGDELHAEALDAAIDAELDREGPKT